MCACVAFTFRQVSGMRGCILINDSSLVQSGPGLSTRFSLIEIHDACLNLSFSVMDKNEINLHTQLLWNFVGYAVDKLDVSRAWM